MSTKQFIALLQFLLLLIICTACDQTPVNPVAQVNPQEETRVHDALESPSPCLYAYWGPFSSWLKGKASEILLDEPLQEQINSKWISGEIKIVKIHLAPHDDILAFIIVSQGGTLQGSFDVRVGKDILFAHLGTNNCDTGMILESGTAFAAFIPLPLPGLRAVFNWHPMLEVGIESSHFAYASAGMYVERASDPSLDVYGGWVNGQAYFSMSDPYIPPLF